MKWPKLVRPADAKAPVLVELQSSHPNRLGDFDTVFKAELLCNYQGTSRTVTTHDGVEAQAAALLLFDGDPFGDVQELGYGSVTDAYGREAAILAGARHYNPDNTVNYTSLAVG